MLVQRVVITELKTEASDPGCRCSVPITHLTHLTHLTHQNQDCLPLTLEFYTFSSVIILADPTDMDTELIVADGYCSFKVWPVNSNYNLRCFA